MAMTEGERMVWAAVFGARMERLIGGDPRTEPRCKHPNRLPGQSHTEYMEAVQAAMHEADYAAFSEAAEIASVVVRTMREDRDELAAGWRDTPVLAMLDEMIREVPPRGEG